ncbi:hypothetical protein Kfla_1912 [Kribbella flavida DSM 17836]|uniref:HSP18 transcriptional regulator n=1 Tax=Kribbella flavida (strain DSM 17836 / JCM 10339 / NBRC 14399) TaxID=479435 RepID=D2PPP4_KRIFD|nr:hypothetical protein [Kribbella flavida]ADB31006.1 hypothetical protein Kfla_1912 [Kribbella flavida DSM 17836]
MPQPTGDITVAPSDPTEVLAQLVGILDHLADSPGTGGPEPSSTANGNLANGSTANGSGPAVEVEDLLAALDGLRWLREQVAGWEPRLIEAARAAGASWNQLAPVLGVASRQAAERRYLRLSPNTSDPTMTGEQRVQAARDRRASDRAVVEWARTNAADLRRLAGQVTALDGLDSKAQASVDRLHDALGADDSAALLAPLAEAGPRLVRDHPTLADRISEVGDQADQVRREAPRRSGRGA